jgi:hypothetical protein
VTCPSSEVSFDIEFCRNDRRDHQTVEFNFSRLAGWRKS